MPAISAKNNTPPCARSNNPGYTTPSSSLPKNSTAAFSGAILPTDTSTKGPALRPLCACKKRAYNSLPVPLSPTNITLVSCCAKRFNCSLIRSAKALRPIGSCTANNCCFKPAFSRSNICASIARSTTNNNLAKDKGFSKNSYAPNLVASTAVSIVPCPDIIITGVTNSAFSVHSFNSVIPSVSGIQISNKIKSS
ncbi:hypothetical protein BAZMOX_05516_0 [methanotrophic endosymbiont of Bathymodiolus azoricus (Menez Gwen)]|nr:hypothetical protein BAZMOX_05516_0 [methanotrophic endosymbiont of Bathymodiolus azoricus (Menez Gwen)]